MFPENEYGIKYNFLPMHLLPDSSVLATRLFLTVILVQAVLAASRASWNGVLVGIERRPVSGATVVLRPSASGQPEYRATTSASGSFVFHEIIPDSYELSVVANGR